MRANKRSRARMSARLSAVVGQPPVAVAIPPGHLGNLTEAQEAKLRALWAIGLKFIEIYEADEVKNPRKTLEDKYVPPAKKSSFAKGVTNEKYPTLLPELLSILPTEEKDLNKLAKQAVEALDHWTPDMYRLIVLRVVKHEHPDALALRFLRATNWDLIKATKMMGKTIYWRTMEAGVDDVILKHGEGGAAEDELNSQGLNRTVSADFMKQIRLGKSFLHGSDRAGRPITYIRVRLHKSSDQCTQSLERYIVYLLEMARLSLQPPIETGTVLVDLTGFSLSNFDLKPLMYLLKCMESYYPEALGLLLVHNAPLGFKTMWRLVKLWVNPQLASKFKFTYGKRALKRYIAPQHIIKELGGDEDWEYEYEEPLPYENAAMGWTETRDELLREREELAQQFEDLTREWVMNAQLSEKAQEIREKRNKLVQALAANYWELDPFIRARSLYDRQGYFTGDGGVDWYHEKTENDSLLKKIRTMDTSETASHHENVSSAFDDESTYAGE